MMLIIVLILVILFFGGGGWYGHRAGWNTAGPGLGVVGLILLILVYRYFVRWHRTSLGLVRRHSLIWQRP